MKLILECRTIFMMLITAESGVEGVEYYIIVYSTSQECHWSKSEKKTSSAAS